MTTSYMSTVTTAVYSISIILMKKWHGNFLKLIWIDLLVFAITYTGLSLLYRLGLNDKQKDVFERLCLYCSDKLSHIPLGFLLGFLTSQVLSRWWSITQNVPRFMKVATIVRINISKGDKSKCVGYRRAIMRHINLAWILKMRLLSPQIWKRFVPTKNPKIHHTNLISTLKYINNDIKVRETLGKLMTHRELEAFIRIAIKQAKRAENQQTVLKKSGCLPSKEGGSKPSDAFHHQPVEYWLPITWAYRTVQQAEKGDHLANAYSRSNIESELKTIYDNLNLLDLQDKFPIPLPYIQTIILGVHVYFLTKMFAEQFLDPTRNVKGHEIDLYFPVFTLLEFMFYFSWYKAALSMLNPHGDDDEDLPLWKICEDNLQLSQDIALADENESEDIEFTENHESEETNSPVGTQQVGTNSPLYTGNKPHSLNINQTTQYPSNHVLTDPDAVFFSSEQEPNLIDKKFELNENEEKVLASRYQKLSRQYHHECKVYDGAAIDAARNRERPLNPFHSQHHQCKHTGNDREVFQQIKQRIEAKENQSNTLALNDFLNQVDADFYREDDATPLVSYHHPPT